MTHSSGMREINLDAELQPITRTGTDRRSDKRCTHNTETVANTLPPGAPGVIVGQGSEKEQCRRADGQALRVATTDERDGVDSEGNAAVRALVKRSSECQHIAVG